MRKIFSLAALLLILGLYGCGDNTVAPVPFQEPVTSKLTMLPVAGYDNICFVDSPALLAILADDDAPGETVRECGDPGDGWQPFPERLQPDSCEPYYYIIDDGKGLVCGPADCASNQELEAMYMHLIALIQHGEWLPIQE